MLKTPKYGWSEITIGNWSDRCNCHDDVPYRLLEAVDYTNRTQRSSSVKFDAEGYMYIIVFDMCETHIICNNDDFNCNWQYTTIDISIKDIIRELIVDIRNNINAWSEWGFDISDYEAEERKLDLDAWCKVIEKRL